MSANSATGSVTQSVQKWVIDFNVEDQLRSGALRTRLLDTSLSNGSIELYLRSFNLAAIGLDDLSALGLCDSLLRVDLSGCPKLESIPANAFVGFEHLVTVVFGEHSNITKIRANVFDHCSALTSITLPDNLKIIEHAAFNKCTSLERVVCNKNLKTIGDNAFLRCSMLEDVQLASSSISFGDYPFLVCDHLIEIADAAGFPSHMKTTDVYNEGAGIVPYLIHRFERSESRRYVLLAHMRFNNAVHAHDGTEEEKVAAAIKSFLSNETIGGYTVEALFKCCHDGGGACGVLAHILSFA